MLSAFLSPLVAIAFGALTLLLGLGLRRRALRWMGGAMVLLGLAGTTSWVGNASVRAIEARADGRARPCAQAEAVVLLSGGLAREPRDRHDFAALSPRTLERVSGLLAQPGWRDRPLIVAGGGRFRTAESIVIGALLQDSGIAASDMLLEDSSLDTWENAWQVRRLRPSLARIALASSALHLPRARIAFQAAGFEVCDWPVHYELGGASGLWGLLPSSGATIRTERALHEAIGHLYYRWRAWRSGGG